VKFKASPSTLSRQAFIERFGGVYEHSPWITERAWDQGLGAEHDDLDTLADALADIVDQAPQQQQLALILAHPDLAGKAAKAGELTQASSREQAGAGINQCNAEEFARFEAFNHAYRAKFEFPFIMAVKGADRHRILTAFERRLPNSYTQEFTEALKQIHKIARFRLEDIARTEDKK